MACHDSSHNLPLNLVLNANHCTLIDGRVREQGILNLQSTDLVATTLNDVN